VRRSLVAVKHATTLHPPHLKEGHWPRSLLSLEKRERRRVPLSPYLLLLLNFVQRRSGYVSNSPCGRECSRCKRREHPGSTNRGVSDEPPPRTGPGGVEARAKARTGERSVPRKRRTTRVSIVLERSERKRQRRVKGYQRPGSHHLQTPHLLR